MLDSVDRLGGKPASHTRHLAALDGMRGIAIVLVMWYHIWQVSWLSADVHILGWSANFNIFAEAGMTGVYLFFFISGFCLFYPYAQTMFDGRALQSVGMFGYRRFLKIVPSYYLGIALWIALGYATFSSPGDEMFQVVSHLLFIQTFFDNTFSGINGVLWSLGVEVQFYVVFPLVCWLMMRRPWFAFALAVAGSNLYRMVVIHHPNAGHEIDQLPGSVDVFVTGMFVAWAFRSIATRYRYLASQRWIWTTVAVLGFVACYFALATVFDRRHDDGWAENWKLYGIPLLTFALIPATLGSLFAFPIWQRILANPILLLFSYVSYNLYMWHQVLARALADSHLTAFRGYDSGPDPGLRLMYTFSAFALAISAAWLVTTFVEQPLLRMRPLQWLFEGKKGRAKTEPGADLREVVAR